MRRSKRRLWTISLTVAAAMLIMIVVAQAASRFLVKAVPGYRDDIERRASAESGRRVTLREVDLSWRRFRPNLDLLDVVVYAEDGKTPALRAREINAGIDWFALLTGRPRLSELRIAGITLTVERLSDGTLKVTGISTDEPLTAEDVRSAARALKRVRRLVITDSQVLWLDYTDPDTFHRVDDIDLVLRTRGSRHSLSASAVLPVHLGGAVQLMATARGDLEKFEQLETESEIEASNLQPGIWLEPWLRAQHAVEGADMHLELASRWQGLRLVSANGELESGALQLVRNGRSQPLMNDIHVEFDVSTLGRGWRVALGQLSLEAPRRETQTTSGSFDVHPAEAEKPLRVAGRLDQLSLQEPGELLALFQIEGNAGLADLRPVGHLHDLNFTYEQLLPEKTPADETASPPPRYSLQTVFTGLGISAHRDHPGFTGGRGTLRLNQAGGTLSLQIKNGQLISPEVFEKPFPLTEVTGDVTWQAQADDWLVSSKLLRWQGPGDLKGQSAFALKLFGDESSSHLALDTRFTGSDMDKIRQFIPRVPDVLDEEVRVWLKRAILRARVTGGHLQVRGLLKDFPFENANEPGVFLIDFDIADGALDYAEGWPIIDRINTHVAFKGRRMDIDAKSGRIHGAPIADVHGEVKDFYKPLLEIGGKATADAGLMLSFLTASPLRSDYAGLVEALKLRGPALLDIKLDIPLDALENTRVAGVVTMDGRTQLNHVKLPEPLSGITGQVRFDNNGLTARDLRAELLGLKLLMQMDPELRGRERLIRLRADSSVAFPRDAQSLSRLVSANSLKYLEGQSALQADMLFDASAKPARLALSSDLTGLTVKLPAPFGKTAAESLPLSVSLDPSQVTGMRADVVYGPLLKAALILNDSGERWTLERGQIRLGGAAAQLPRTAGLTIEGGLPELDLTPWQAVLATPAAAAPSTVAPAPAATTPVLRSANLQFGALKFSNQRFENLRLQLAQETGDWVMRARAPTVDGTARWPVRTRGRSVYQVDLQKLVLRAREQKKESAADKQAEADEKPRDPALLPGLNLRCRDLQVNDFSMGALQIDVTPVANGVELTRLSLEGELAISGRGGWTRSNNASAAQLELDVEGSNLKPLFTALGYSPSLEAEKAKLGAKLVWSPRPEGIKTEALGGNFSLDLQRGQLLAVEPGAGRVLGLLNFYALPRRLTLDFRDVLSSGLAFDTLTGDFRIDKGDAWTENLKIRGPSMQIAIVGRVGLVGRDYDQKVTIHPQTSAGVALAGTALGGPAVGLAILIAQQLFKKPLENMSELSYRLHGPWEDPIIERSGG